MIKDWKELEPRFEQLLNREINSPEELENLLIDRSNLLAEIDEDLAWRYINMTRFTENKEYARAYEHFMTDIYPNVVKYSNLLNKKIADSQYLNDIEPKYKTVVREIKKEIELFREENIPLMSKVETVAQKFGQISGKMTIKCKGEEYTMQQASKFLHDPDRSFRKKIYGKIANRRLKDTDKLNKLLSELVDIRHQIALNAGFDNYRDYKHNDLGRFDYSVEDVKRFDESIATEAVPVLDKLMAERKQKLGVEPLKPWDLEVDTDNKPPVKVFDTIDDFIKKSVAVLSDVKPQYGSFLQKMADEGFLDLESRKGKAPGGYNYPLLVSNIPFIFMNAAGNMHDLQTLMHESGHAIHSFLYKDLQVIEQKELPSEVAELASMSMELISMEHWDKFFDNEEDLRRAKKYQLDSVLRVLPWIALIDSFQHWLYEKPQHTTVERYNAWTGLARKYFSKEVDWTSFEWYFMNIWQKQGHIFEVPFYYIEYAIAQLGAIAIWRNYKKNPQKTLEQYEQALSLGYSKTIPEIYQTAGIKFDFSAGYIRELMQFVWSEYEKI